MSQRIRNDVEMVKLVELYRENSVLWDVDNKQYKNRDARNSAYIKIAEELCLPLNIVCRKIRNMKSNYSRETKKLQKSVRSGARAGAIYKPKLVWFDTANSFLKKYVTNNETDENLLEEFTMGTEEIDTKNEDEFDAFSKSIAASLRNMPRNHYLSAKAKILHTISHIQFEIAEPPDDLSLPSTSTEPFHDSLSAIFGTDFFFD